MLQPITLLDGAFSADAIKLDLAKTAATIIDRELQLKIEIIWRQMQADAQAKGLRLWDSASYRLIECHKQGDTVSLKIGPIRYKDNIALSIMVSDGTLDASHATNFMYCSLFIRTSDGNYLFGQGGEHHAWQQGVRFIGGSYCQDELALDSSEALFLHPLHELEEETGISKTSISDFRLRKIVRTPRGLAAFIFTGQTTLTTSEVRRIFQSTQDSEKEFTSLLTLTADETRAMLREKGGHFNEMLDLID